MSTNRPSWQVAPLEHIVHLEGHVTQKKHKLASGTLGARGASWRARHAIEANEASGTLGERGASWRARNAIEENEASGTLGAHGASWRARHTKETLEASGTLGARSVSSRARRIDDVKGTNLDIPETLTPLEILKMTPLIDCHPVRI